MFLLCHFDSWVGILCNTHGVHVVSGTLRGPCSHDCNGWVRVLLLWVNAVLSARRFELSSSVRNACHSKLRLFCSASIRLLPFRGLDDSVRHAAHFCLNVLTFVAGTVRFFFLMRVRIGLCSNCSVPVRARLGLFGLIRGHSGWPGPFRHGSGCSEPIRAVRGGQIRAAWCGPDTHK